MKKLLFLFTVDFPFGKSEASFLPSELKYVAPLFDKVHLFPFILPQEQLKQALPKNVETEAVFSRLECKRPKLTLRLVFQINRVLISEFLHCNNKIGFIKSIRAHISQLLNYSFYANALADYLYSQNINLKHCVFYTYWFDEWSSIIAWLKCYVPGYKNLQLVSRAHGFDLYHYRHQAGYIFPRQLQINAVNKLVLISKNGNNYMTRHFPKQVKKMALSRLAIEKPVDKDNVNTISDRPIYTIVSCSEMVAVKRLHLIVDILNLIDLDIRWIHFGEGKLMSSLRTQCDSLPKNIQVEFKGYVENADLLQFYQHNQVDFLINVSESEGIPVSMMEAISYGIPIVATDVGGVSEIVSTDMGILLDKEFSAEKAASQIKHFLLNKNQNLEKNLMKYWQEHYSAEKNYSQFANILVECVND